MHHYLGMNDCESFLLFNVIVEFHLISSKAYGMSESTGPHCVNSVIKGFQMNSAGKTTPGAVTKILNPDKDGNGEVNSDHNLIANLFFIPIWLVIELTTR